MPKHLQFQRLVNESKADPNILGFLLAGSRGKGFENRDSDYDPYMIVKDAAAKIYRSRYENMKLEEIHLAVLSLSEFRKYAAWGSPSSGDRYDFTHVRIFVDKNNIGKIVAEKGSIPKGKQKSFISSSLDSYINSMFRSIKCLKNGNNTGVRLEAAKSIYPLLDAIFALELRPRPFDGYLEKELKKYPLKKFPWKKEEFIRKILFIQATADLKTQQEILKNVEKLFRKEGYNRVFDGWGKDLIWMKSVHFSYLQF